MSEEGILGADQIFNCYMAQVKLNLEKRIRSKYLLLSPEAYLILSNSISKYRFDTCDDMGYKKREVTFDGLEVIIDQDLKGSDLKVIGSVDDELNSYAYQQFNQPKESTNTKPPAVEISLEDAKRIISRLRPEYGSEEYCRLKEAISKAEGKDTVKESEKIDSVRYGIDWLQYEESLRQIKINNEINGKWPLSIDALKWLYDEKINNLQKQIDLLKQNQKEKQ